MTRKKQKNTKLQHNLPKGSVRPVGPVGPVGPVCICQHSSTNKYPQADTGDKGDKGPVGDKGPLGDKSDKGDKGPLGDKGPIGDKGVTGDKGPDGDKSTLVSVIPIILDENGDNLKTGIKCCGTPPFNGSITNWIMVTTIPVVGDLTLIIKNPHMMNIPIH